MEDHVRRTARGCVPVAFILTLALALAGGCKTGDSPQAARKGGDAEVEPGPYKFDPPDTRPWRKFDFVEPKMGAPFRITLYCLDEKDAQAAAAAAFARVDELNQVLSNYDPDSELSRLSDLTRDGPMREPVAVSRDLWVVLARSVQAAERSGGAFDVTVGPLMRLWRRSRDTGELPTPERLAKTRESVGYQHIRLDPAKHTVQLLAPKMRIDVSGIAVGYVTEQAVAALWKADVRSALVDAGGDLFVGDPPPGRKGWRVAIQSLEAPEQTTGEYVELRNAAISTSGDTYRFVEIDGKRYSHILDPATGLGLTRRIGVTVIAPHGMTADWLDTAVAVMGPEKGMELVEQTPGAAARITTVEGEATKVYMSERFRDFLVDPDSPSPRPGR